MLMYAHVLQKTHNQQMFDNMTRALEGPKARREG